MPTLINYSIFFHLGKNITMSGDHIICPKNKLPVILVMFHEQRATYFTAYILISNYIFLNKYFFVSI